MTSIETPFSAAGGLVTPVVEPSDPFEALDHLMLVVEALCPAWPVRDTFGSTSQMRL